MAEEDFMSIDDFLDDEPNQTKDKGFISLEELLGDDMPKDHKQVQERKQRVKNYLATPKLGDQEMVAFRNKAGDLITGPGSKYIVVRHQGKLNYKKFDQVVRLPADWKEGDPINWGEIGEEPPVSGEDLESLLG